MQELEYDPEVEETDLLPYEDVPDEDIGYGAAQTEDYDDEKEDADVE